MLSSNQKKLSWSDLCPHDARQWRYYLDNLLKGLTVNSVQFNHAYGNHFAHCILFGVFRRGSAREIILSELVKGGLTSNINVPWGGKHSFGRYEASLPPWTVQEIHWRCICHWWATLMVSCQGKIAPLRCCRAWRSFLSTVTRKGLFIRHKMCVSTACSICASPRLPAEVFETDGSCITVRHWWRKARTPMEYPFNRTHNSQGVCVPAVLRVHKALGTFTLSVSSSCKKHNTWRISCCWHSV